MKRKLLNKKERQNLMDYVRYYVYERRTMGVWWGLALSIQQALTEIDYHRSKGRKT